MAFRAPLLGYNTNVRHKGKLYHIQTEDSGVDHPHVITHLFADGGRIVASKKTSYADRVGSDGLPDQVKKLMQGQHKAMFISLRDGLYDEDASDEPLDATRSGAIDLTATDVRAPAEPPATPAQPDENKLAEVSSEVSLGAQGAGDVAALPVEQTDEPVADEPAADDVAPHESELPEPITEVSELVDPGATGAGAREARLADRVRERFPLPPASKAALPALRLAEAGPRGEADEAGSVRQADPRADKAERPAATPERAATALKANDGPRSLFGGDLLSDKSLDEVILNYLAANEKDA